MASKKGGLGKGLDSLIPSGVNTKQLNKGITAEKDAKDSVVLVKLSKVEPNREQPRKNFDEDGLNELSESIKQYGIIQPLIVQEKNGYYEIIAGERRWRAAKIAGLKEVPVIIRSLSDQEVMEISLIENIQREDLNPIEEALAYKRLLEEFHLKQEEVAKRVSKSRTTITNSMRLLKLTEEVQKMVVDGKLTTGHARCLIPIENPDIQKQAAEQIAEHNLSVREAEKLVKQILAPKKGKITAPADISREALYENIADQMKQILGTKVEIRQKDANKGKIEIEYYSQDELDRLLGLMKSISDGR